MSLLSKNSLISLISSIHKLESSLKHVNMLSVMKLKTLALAPPNGWGFIDPATKNVILENTYQELIATAVHKRALLGVEVPSSLGQIIQNQICDGIAQSERGKWCEEYGLGDVVSAIAQPIAKVIDRIAGTSIKTCGACAQRRANLNKLGRI